MAGNGTTTTQHTPTTVAVAPSYPLAEALEDRLRELVHKRSILLASLLRDFDRLRSGKVTGGQLVRCLTQACNARFAEEAVAELVQKYGCGRGLVNYEALVDSVEMVFTGKHFERRPDATVPRPSDVLRRRETSGIPDELQGHLEGLLQRLREYVRARGIIIRDLYRDFDIRRSGLVTKSQFVRLFPGPKDLAEVELMLLQDNYDDPATGLFNYAALHSDVVAGDPVAGIEPARATRTVGHVKPLAAVPPADEVLERLRVAFFKTRVRPLEFFRDYDRLRCSRITANQFGCGLALACSAPGGLRLHRDEVAALAQRFTEQDGRVNYRRFCQAADKEFTHGQAEDFEATPQAVAPARRRQTIVCETVRDGLEDDSDTKALLERIRERIRLRRLDILPQFRDYDRKFGFTKGVTATQFGRLCDACQLGLSQREVASLVAKYTSPTTGHVSYLSFVGDVDPTAKTVPGEAMYFDREAHGRDHLARTAMKEGFRPSSGLPVDLDRLVARFKHRVVERRVRVADFFVDYDKLRSGFVTDERFRQALKNVCPDLQRSELRALVEHYRTGAGPKPMCWRQFEADVEALFASANLDKNPRGHVPDLSDTTRSLRQLTMASASERLNEDEILMYEDAMDVCRHSLQQRSVDLRPPFRDSDRQQTGHVTLAQFLKTVTSLGLGLTHDQATSLGQYYMGEKGISYRAFASDLQPVVSVPNLYDTRLHNTTQTARLRDDAHTTKAAQPVVLEALIHRLRSEVSKRRLRLQEMFKARDRLNHRRVAAPGFAGVLGACHLHVSPAEVRALEQEYAAPGFPGSVAYQQFCSDLELRHDLELDPLGAPLEFVAAVGVEETKQLHGIDAHALEATDGVLDRIASLCHRRKVHLLPDFADFDKARRGAVSKQQFTRVLLDNNIALSAAETDQLMQAFAVVIGGRVDVHFREFNAEVEHRIGTLTRAHNSSLSGR